MANAKNGYGKPVYDDIYSNPQDTQDAVDFADEFANVRRGTSAERQALPAAKQRAGMLWSETDTGDLYRTDGASNWRLLGDTGWLPLTLGTGWNAVTGHAPRGRRINGVVHVEGAVIRASGGLHTNIATLPGPLRIIGPGKTTFIGPTVAGKTGGVSYQEMYTDTSGVIGVSGYTSMDGTIDWVLPLTSTFVQDQR